MKKNVYLITVFVAFALVIGVYQSHKAGMVSFHWTRYKEPQETTAIEHATFETEHLHIRLAFAEGQYLVVIEVLTDTIELIYHARDTDIRSLIKGKSITADQVSPERLSAQQITIYPTKGRLLKKPLASYYISLPADVPYYHTLQEAQEALLDKR